MFKKTPAKTLMIQGTTSDAGKSAMVVGLCRLFQRRGIKVAPFKPQNMALNSAVTSDGGEIGRAQAVQAQACGLEPHTDMNPVLLKPNSDTGCQVIINGHAVTNMDAVEYHQYKRTAKKAVLEAYDRLQQQYELIIVEGAGSPAEINLRENDIANMGFAESVDCPVILVSDIDRGGVFAHLYGTVALLSPSEQKRIKGFVINKFRGDPALLDSGLTWLEQKTSTPVLGVLPYLHNLHLQAEDGFSEYIQPSKAYVETQEDKLRIVVPVLPRISNHTDLDPLRLHPQIDVYFIGENQPAPPADLIILPGSKSVSADLNWLKKQGWVESIQKHLRYGGKLIGICGGFQMLGKKIHDPDKIESNTLMNEGLSLLDMETTLTERKKLENVSGFLQLDNVPVNGYEIHMGISTGPALQKPAIILDERNDGAFSNDNQIMGTYLHGLFEHTEACESVLQWAGLKIKVPVDYQAIQESGINLLADTLEENIDLTLLERMILN